MTKEFAEKFETLSPRQKDVANVVAKGLSTKDAAKELFICEKTVKFHLTDIYKKLSVKSRAQFIVEYYADDNQKYIFEEEPKPEPQVEVERLYRGNGQQII